MVPEILTKFFAKRKIILEIAQRCRVEELKLSCMAQKLNLVSIMYGSETKFSLGPNI